MVQCVCEIKWKNIYIILKIFETTDTNTNTIYCGPHTHCTANQVKSYKL